MPRPLKVAALADPHGNLTALEAVVAHIDGWQPDHVVVAGDVINRGPQPLACLQLVQQRMATQGWRAIKGNHEEYVLAARDDASRRTLAQLQGNHVFEHWPDQITLRAPDGSTLDLWHASPVNNRDCIWPEPRTSDDQLRAKLGTAPPAVLCVGHTHVPLTRTCNGTLVVNTGSVGLSFDGDPSASYAQLTWRRDGWRAEIVRLGYDRARTEAAFASSGFANLPLARLVMHELRTARPLLARWDYLFLNRIRAGELSVTQSVDEMLRA
jgi:putative phosphoesterase